jgi:IS5 family transposase
LPLATVVVGANVHDSKLVVPTLAKAAAQPVTAPSASSPPHLCQDKGYDFPRVVAEDHAAGYVPHIRHRGEEGRPDPATGERHPARRWVVERFFAWLKGFRAIRTRYTCSGRLYDALLDLACALILFRAAGVGLPI